MARELRLDVVNQTKGEGLAEAARGVDHLRRETNRLESEFRQAVREAEKLDRQLLETKAATAALAREFAKTGGTDTALAKQLAQQRRLTTQLRAARGDIVGDTEKNAKASEAALAKATAQFQKLRAEFEKTHSVEILVGRIARVKAEIEKVRLAQKALNDEWGKGFDLDVSKRIDLNNRNLNALHKTLRLLTNEAKNQPDKGLFGFFANAATGAAKAGTDSATTFSAAFQGGILSGFKALPAPAQAAIISGLAGALAAVAPFIGATISAAVIGGVGAGGLVGGIVLAARSAKVQAAFKDFAGSALQSLTDSAQSFVDPLTRVAKIFKDAFTGGPIAGGLQKTFESLSKSLEPLARGLVGLVAKALPGLQKIAEAAGKLFTKLGAEMPRFGAALSSFFESLANNADGAIDALVTILRLTEGIIIAFGKWAGEASRVFHSLYVLSGQGLLERLFNPQPASNMAQVLDIVVASLNGVRHLLLNTADAADQANDAFHRLFGEAMNLDEANLAVKKGFLDLRDAFKENGKTLDDNTAKGQANKQAIFDQIKLLEEQRDAAIAAGDGTKAGTDKANAAYIAQIEKLRALAVAAGLPVGPLDAILDKYKDIAQQADIDKTITIHYKTVGTPTGVTELGRGLSRDKFNERASGGTVMRGQPYLVGENGPEIIWPGSAGYVSNASDTARMLSGAGGGSRPLNLVYNGDTGGLDGLFYSWLMKAVRDGRLQLA